MTVNDSSHLGSMRSRARPKALLVDLIEEPILRFKDRLGSVIYDTEWVRISKKSHQGDEREPVGSTAGCAFLVEEQILEALKLGIVRASVKPMVTMKKSVAKVENDDGLPHLVKVNLFTDFWSSDTESGIDWGTGTVHLKSLINLQNENNKDPAKENLSEIYEELNSVQLSIFIQYPMRAMNKIFILDQIPDSQWFERYSQYRSQGRLEAITAGWRYLATSDVVAQSLSNAALARIMTDYLQAQGFDPLVVSPRRETTQGLDILAKHMLAQLAKRERNASVLVSSSKR